MKFLSLYVYAILKLSIGHEMCANDKVLAKLKSPLKFCSDPSEYGCCTKQYENTIRIRYNDIIYQFPKNLQEKCSPYIKDMLCHLCYPMSAHSFESDAKLEIPGLCPNFCQKFYNDCHQIIKYLGENVYKLYLDSQSEGSKSWCEKVQTFDEDYCFPEVITNKKLTSERSVLAVKSNSEKCVCFKQFEEYEGETTLPVKMQEVDDGSGRLFVAELPGIISVFHPNGSKEKLPFLNITDRIYRQGKNREIGLMSFIFHPSYKSNGKIYVIYAAKGRHTMKLHEFTMTTNYSIKKEREILKTIPPGLWHNLDDLIFGYDGYLYVFNGDGGVQADFFNLAQNTSVFFGKALRIDVDNMSEEKPYAIPPDNPFIEDTAFAPEIYAYGLRNPWRCTLDTGDPVTGENKGRIMCGDVGQGGYEEINIIKKGGNYGWKKKEGFGCFRSNECNDIPNEELPIHSYNHKYGKSITGGEVYRGNCIPHLQGKYIFAEYMFGYINTLTEDEDGSWTADDLTVCNKCPSPLTNDIPMHVLSFGRDKKGEVYVLTTTKHGVQQTLPGYIYKIVHPDTYEWCPHEWIEHESDDVVKENEHEDLVRVEIPTSPPNNVDENDSGVSTIASDSIEAIPIQKEEILSKAEGLSTKLSKLSAINDETGISELQVESNHIFSTQNSDFISSSTTHMNITSSVYLNELTSPQDVTSSISTLDKEQSSDHTLLKSENSVNQLANDNPLLVIVPTPTSKEEINVETQDKGAQLQQQDSQNDGDINNNIVGHAANGSSGNVFSIYPWQNLIVMVLIMYFLNMY